MGGCLRRNGSTEGRSEAKCPEKPRTPERNTCGAIGRGTRKDPGWWVKDRAATAKRLVLDAPGRGLASAAKPTQGNPGGVPVRKGGRVGPPLNSGPGVEWRGARAWVTRRGDNNNR